MILWWEAIVSPEAVQYLGVNPACISLLQDGTRLLTWWILTAHPNTEGYHTIRWFSDAEKRSIQEEIRLWDMESIQNFLNKYI